MTDTCQCGSGLPFARCHGDPRNDFAREQALREAEAVPSLFPRVRVTGIDGLVDRAAERGREIRDAELERIVDEIPEGERRRVVRLWAEPYADRWESMVRTAADAAAAERALVRGAVVAAVDERSVPPRALVAPLEDAPDMPPYPALSVLLPPPAVWSIDEARAAAIAASGRRSSSERLDVVEELAFALVTFEHVARTRVLAARLAAALPFPGLPRASRLIESACANVAAEADAARATAACLLMAYAERLLAADAARFG